MTSTLHRVAMGMLFPILVACAALRHADQQVKAFTDKAFHKRDPDRAKQTDASTPKKAKARKSEGVAKADPEEAAKNAQNEPDKEAEESSPAASAAAETLFEKGHEAMEKKDYDTACARFRESDRLDPAVGSKLNLANCEQQRGRYATSWQLFRLVLGQLPTGDDRIAIAKERIRELEPKIPKVTFQLDSGVAPNEGEDITVKGNGVSFRLASFGVPLPFDPGKHRFVVDAPGHRSRTYEIEVKPAEKRVLTVQPGAKNR